MSLVEGQIVGPYRVVGQLGQGGMATVYKAYHAKLDRYVAIKVIQQAFQGDATFIARFEREAQIVAKLEHRHIVPVYDYNEHEGRPYLVMKFIEGRTLKNLLSAGRLSLEQTLNVMTPIADALTYAHQHGVLHRDMKPSNIIMDQEGVLYLTDFGLAKIAQDAESTMSQDMMLGTPQYISPEQAKGEKVLDARTDIYSLGVVLYEMVVGRVPFNADTPYAIVHDHIYTKLPAPSTINPDIPKPVENVLLKALAKNPDERYTSAVDLIEDFRQAVVQTGSQAVKPDDSMVQAAPPPRTPAQPDKPKKVIVERRFDAGEMDFSDLGERIEQRVKQGAEFVGNLAFTMQEAFEQQREASLSEEERIRRRVEKRFKERQGLIIHFVAYVMVNFMLWAIWAGGSITSLIQAQEPSIPTGMLGLPWPLFVTIGWGIGMISHYINYYSKYGSGAERREQAIQREIERERERSMAQDYDLKPKRMRLTDDGELEEASNQQKRKRR
jgi:tRNA A-37 threonylcarbamoyl transferase component Bud32